MTIRKSRFLSNFAPLLQAFTDEKKALGYKYESECSRLQHFDRYCLKSGQPAILDKALAVRYLSLNVNRSAKTTLNMIGLLRQFAFTCIVTARMPTFFLQNCSRRKNIYTHRIYLQGMK